MFLNKNNDIDKDWKDYEKYKKEKEKRDRELYQNDYPLYDYNENEHHVHDDRCDIGLPQKKQFGQRQIKTTVMIVTVVSILIMASVCISHVRGFIKRAESKKTVNSNTGYAYYVSLDYYSEVESFYVAGSKFSDHCIKSEIKKVADNDIKSLDIEFVFYDKHDKKVNVSHAEVDVSKLESGQSVIAQSDKVFSDTVRMDVTIKLKELN